MADINKMTINGTTYDIEGKSIYSLDEKVIGTWINGKPLYRKVFIVNNPATDTVSYLSYEDLNIENLINIAGYATDGDISIPVNFYYSTATYMYTHNDITGHRIKYKFTPWSFTTICFVLEYTKTTDEDISL